jgi:plasmid stabilization system protein ParE
MSYDIHITSAAERDLIRAADHIEFNLKNPKAADDLLDEAEKQINSLSDFPEKFRLVDDPVLASWGIRFVIVKGYLAFYTIEIFSASISAIPVLGSVHVYLTPCVPMTPCAHIRKAPDFCEQTDAL